jgi:hypothetical protein
VSIIEDPVAWAEAQKADPVRRRILLALARRVATQPPGVLRDELVVKLRARASRPHVQQPVRASAMIANPLADLLSQLQTNAGQELRQVRIHESTWRRLKIASHIAEVSAPVPLHLGPLNSQVLASRALQQLKSLAPDYLHRLLTQMDTIAALAPLRADIEPDRPPGAVSKKSPVRRMT